MRKLIKVLVVDDSALIRTMLTKLLDSHEAIEVCGTASDPYDAREKIKSLNPDVLTLDIEMPRMNGISFLKNLMRLRPMPVVMISTLTQAGAPSTLEALELGAVDFVPKPKNEATGGLADYAEDICDKVIAASKANLAAFNLNGGDSKLKAKKVSPHGGVGRSGFVCAIGASTGGTEAIKAVMLGMPEDCPPIMITQHIPASFSESFARRVDAASAPKVHQAEHGQPVEAGNAYIAPGHSHLRLKVSSGKLICALDDNGPINRHMPAVEPLFDSVIKGVGDNCLGILLTGMGVDGAKALLRMRQAGAATVAQDEKTSVVWGMPGAAVELEAAQKVLSLDKVPREIVKAYFRV